MRKIIKNILMVLVVVFVCAGCNKNNPFNDHVTYLSDSMKTITTIKTSIKAHDSDVLVYESNSEIVLLEDSTAEVTKNVTSLNASFQLETKTSQSTITDIDRTKLLNMNLNKSLLNNLTIEDGKMTFSLSKENIKTVLNFNDVEITEDANCEFNFTDNKINTIKITFTTTSNKNVEVIISYLY